MDLPRSRTHSFYATLVGPVDTEEEDTFSKSVTAWYKQAQGWRALAPYGSSDEGSDVGEADRSDCAQRKDCTLQHEAAE